MKKTREKTEKLFKKINLKKEKREFLFILKIIWSKVFPSPLEIKRKIKLLLSIHSENKSL